MAVLPAIIIVVLVVVVDEMVTAHEIHCAGSVHNVWLGSQSRWEHEMLGISIAQEHAD